MFGWIRKAFKRWFRKAPEKLPEEPREVVVSSEIATPLKGNINIALVVGHNGKYRGATNYLKESEWVFNTRIARKVKEKLLKFNIGSAIIFRPEVKSYGTQIDSVVEKVKSLEVTHAICMHFNDAGESARGCEVLVTETPTKEDNEFGDKFSDILNERYGIRERGREGVKTIDRKHGGYGMLNGLNRAGLISVLIEPCFGGHSTSESRAIFENEDGYADAIVDSIISEWK